MTTTLLAIAWVVGLVIAALVAVPSKMISDEVRARIDDLPILFVRLALMQLPEDMRAYYEPDWMGNALAAFNDQTAKYPVTQFFRSFKFGFALIIGARLIRKETKAIRQTAKNVIVKPAPAFIAVRGGLAEVKVLKTGSSEG